MKNLFNNLTEQEKEYIRRQHVGGMVVETKKFRKLLTEKLGNVKPIINEQEEVDPTANFFKEQGYSKVDKISLPNGKYKTNGSGDVTYIEDFQKKQTGYALWMPFRIRGTYPEQIITITNGIPSNNDGLRGYYYKNIGYTPSAQAETGDEKQVINKVATEGIQNVTSEMISSPQFKGTYSGYQFGGEFNGVNYQWDCNGVEGMSGVRGMVEGEIISETLENMFSSIGKTSTDGKPGTPCVGFYGGDNSRFVIYTTTSGKPKCLYF